jgi:hypothetical protein
MRRQAAWVVGWVLVLPTILSFAATAMVVSNPPTRFIEQVSAAGIILVLHGFLVGGGLAVQASPSDRAKGWINGDPSR